MQSYGLFSNKHLMLVEDYTRPCFVFSTSKPDSPPTTTIRLRSGPGDELPVTPDGKQLASSGGHMPTHEALNALHLTFVSTYQQRHAQERDQVSTSIRHTPPIWTSSCDSLAVEFKAPNAQRVPHSPVPRRAPMQGHRHLEGGVTSLTNSSLSSCSLRKSCLSGVSRARTITCKDRWSTSVDYIAKQQADGREAAATPATTGA